MRPEDDGYEVVYVPTPEAFEEWLAANHATAGGVWLKMARKATGVPSIDWPQAVDVALCYGWIDGQRGKLDDTYFIQRFTPRRARSRWSKTNRNNVERLIAAGRMQPAGLAEVERAKADGRWDAAYDAPSTATVPDDLQAALDANPPASDFFATLTSQNRYAILYRVQEAKRPETRAKRIAHFVEMLAEGRTLH